MYSILIEKDCRISRDELMETLKERGIDTRPFFVPLHKMPYLDEGLTLPVAEGLSAKGINLPSSAKLTKREIEFISDEIKKLC